MCLCVGEYIGYEVLEYCYCEQVEYCDLEEECYFVIGYFVVEQYIEVQQCGNEEFVYYWQEYLLWIVVYQCIVQWLYYQYDQEYVGEQKLQYEVLQCNFVVGELCDQFGWE